jgi:hypothetical protein
MAQTTSSRPAITRNVHAVVGVAAKIMGHHSEKYPAGWQGASASTRWTACAASNGQHQPHRRVGCMLWLGCTFWLRRALHGCPGCGDGVSSERV